MGLCIYVRECECECECGDFWLVGFRFLCDRDCANCVFSFFLFFFFLGSGSKIRFVITPPLGVAESSEKVFLLHII